MESLNAAQSALKTLCRIFESRLEMFSLETAIEKKKVALILGATIFASGFALLTFIFAGILLILLSPEAYRPYVAAGCMLLNFLLAGVFAWVLAREVRGRNVPYAHTRDELRKDLACLATAVKSGE